MTDRRGLGRGLSALIPAEEGRHGAFREVRIDAVTPNPRQPREVFDAAELEELASSIREVGVLQPVVVREAGPGRYELVAGERRLRAARMAGLERVPAVVRDTSDADLLREALIENIHRTQLNPLEEAAAYRQLLDDFDVTQEELAARLGKSRPTLTNALRLLSLPPRVQRRVAAGVLSAGHAKALLGLSDRDEQERLAERIVAEGLSVRATEEAVRLLTADHGRRPPRRRSQRRTTAPVMADLEVRLSDALATPVRLRMGARKGTIAIDFTTVEDLERIVGVIAAGLRTTITVSGDGRTDDYLA